MYLIVIAWLYVTVMMAVAEAASPQGSWLGALITLLLYGLLPLAILVYILDTPQRKRRIKARQQDQVQAQDCAPTATSAQPDAGSHAPGTAEHGSIAPVREKL